jgi:hypothetical protein
MTPPPPPAGGGAGGGGGGGGGWWGGGWGGGGGGGGGGGAPPPPCVHVCVRKCESVSTLLMAVMHGSDCLPCTGPCWLRVGRNVAKTGH